MGKECIGICSRYETTYNRQAYARGFKYCARCKTFIKIVLRMCPCCGGFLRTKSHQNSPSIQSVSTPKIRRS